MAAESWKTPDQAARPMLHHGMYGHSTGTLTDLVGDMNTPWRRESAGAEGVSMYPGP